MRTYGRIYDELGEPTWVEVETADNGDNSYVYITTLIQCLKLILQESPFYANYGIPAIQSVVQQILPDFYVAQTQVQFAPYFASLIVSRISADPPTYQVNVVTKQGARINATVAG